MPEIIETVQSFLNQSPQEICIWFFLLCAPGLIIGGVYGYLKDKGKGALAGSVLGGIFSFVLVFVSIAVFGHFILNTGLLSKICDKIPDSLGNKSECLVFIITFLAGSSGGLLGGRIGLFLLDYIKKPRESE